MSSSNHYHQVSIVDRQPVTIIDSSRYLENDVNYKQANVQKKAVGKKDVKT